MIPTDWLPRVIQPHGTDSSVPTFCPWCYDHDRYPYAGIRTCRVCGHILEYQTGMTVYSPWHGGGG